MDIEEVGRNIVDGAVKVHSALGPGLLESAYQACLDYELTKRGLKVACEVPVPITYSGHIIETGYRIDMLVENCVIIENKVAEKLLPLHEAQLITYLKLKGCWLGYLLNWNTVLMKHGIRRIVYGTKPE
jgi:GxxExxY protein